MSKFKFELNRAGVGELLKGAEMQAVLSDYASQVQQRAGEGYEAVTEVKGTRAVSTIRAASSRAYYENLKHNTLLKAVSK